MGFLQCPPRPVFREQNSSLFRRSFPGEKAKDKIGPYYSSALGPIIRDNDPPIDLESKSRHGGLDRIFVAKSRHFLPFRLLGRSKDKKIIVVLVKLHFIPTAPVEGKFLKCEKAQVDQTDILVQKIDLPAQKINPGCGN